ncbi:MAG: thioesterase [Sphingomonas sp.]|nr:thioesterase [Sphingomonas sp.]
MPRPDLWRLSPDAYPHREVIQTRFQDLDVLGHINNVGMAAILESGRIRFNQVSGLDGWRAQARWLVAQVVINYLGEGHFPADVVVASGIGAIGTRSWTILSTAFQHGQPIATCDTVVVMSSAGGATALPDDYRVALAEWQVRGDGVMV